MSDTLLFAAILIPCLVIAIVFHEVAHGWAALALGDPTAKEQRRLSFNPIRHVDPIGTIVVPGALALFGGPVFGWAKPVPVNFGNLNKPRQQMIWVAAAGPGANLLMAVLWAIGLRMLVEFDVDEAFFVEMARAGVFVNIGLMALNLLPVPPLDGGRILTGLLPARYAWRFARIERYGLMIVLALMATRTLGFFLEPFYRFGMAIVRLFV